LVICNGENWDLHENLRVDLAGLESRIESPDAEAEDGSVAIHQLAHAISVLQTRWCEILNTCKN